MTCQLRLAIRLSEFDNREPKCKGISSCSTSQRSLYILILPSIHYIFLFNPSIHPSINPLIHPLSSHTVSNLYIYEQANLLLWRVKGWFTIKWESLWRRMKENIIVINYTETFSNGIRFGVLFFTRKLFFKKILTVSFYSFFFIDTPTTFVVYSPFGGDIFLLWYVALEIFFWGVYKDWFGYFTWWYLVCHAPRIKDM